MALVQTGSCVGHEAVLGMPWCLGVSVVQCEAIMKVGRQCAMTATSTFQCNHGHCVAEPLCRGGRTCLFHLELFRSLPSPLHHSDFCIFWLDFELSGLQWASIWQMGVIVCNVWPGAAIRSRENMHIGPWRTQLRYVLLCITVQPRWV